MNSRCATKRTLDLAGFSMVEVVVSTLLVGIVLVTALNSVGGAIKTWEATDNDLERNALAHELMAEILAKAYADPEDPNNDDYHNWNASPPEDNLGNQLSGYTGWQRLALIKKLRSVNPQQALSPSSPEEGVKEVKVQVFDAGGNLTHLIAIRGKTGAVEQAFGRDATVVTGIDLQIQVGAEAGQRRGVNLLNHAQGP